MLHYISQLHTADHKLIMDRYWRSWPRIFIFLLKLKAKVLRKPGSQTGFTLSSEGDQTRKYSVSRGVCIFLGTTKVNM